MKVDKRYWKDQDIELRGGGYVRTWPSVDVKKRVCIKIDCNTDTHRMTPAEIRRLIARLSYLLSRLRLPNAAKRRTTSRQK